MQGPFWRMIFSPCVQSRISASACRNALLGLLGAFLLLSPLHARADIYYVTLYNVTFQAPCIGSKALCTEVINGSGDYDPTAMVASNLSVSMTGSLNVSLDAFGTPTCTVAPGCLGGNVLYDPNALPGFNPIELFVAILNYNVPTPQPLLGGSGGTLLFVPGMCGGDQGAACGANGSFPGNGMIDYQLTSGTYTSFDLGPSSVPEPGSSILLATGMAMLGLLSIRRTRYSKLANWFLPVLALCWVPAHAATLLYTDSGTFSASTPSSTFTGPGEAWSFVFEADTNPVILSSGMGGFNFVFSNFSYSLNGSPIAITPTFIHFFSPGNGGGFAICFSGTTVATCADGIGSPLFGPALYSGTTAAPTLLPGQFTESFAAIVGSNSYSQSDTTVHASVVPEPSSLSLLSVAAGLLAFVERRVYRRRLRHLS